MSKSENSANAVSSHFHKKIFSKIDAKSSPIKIISPSGQNPLHNAPLKKIVPTTASGGLREKFKETFIPLFIEVFELRQMIDNYKAEEVSPNPFLTEKSTKSPKEILKQLEDLQKNIEESRRWHEGMILQIERGIEEARQALSNLHSSTNENIPSNREKKASFFSFLKKWLSRF
ncbi:MAG: hypothetical protein Tsb0015_04390 [Simkaniaceae bacterium]